MNERTEITVSAGALLLAAALWLFDRTGMVSVLIPAVMVHELGHAAAIAAMGGHIETIAMEASGFRMDYRGVMGRGGELFAAAAGPASGLILSLAAAAAGRGLGSEFLKCLAGVSFALSLFNLLPVFPLDGGRMLSVCLEGLLPDISDTVMLLSGIIAGGGIVLFGLYTAYKFGTFSPISAGIWILLSNIKANGLVKNR